MPIQSKLQFLADLYFRLKEQNEVLQRKFENEHDLFEEWKATISKDNLGDQVLDVKEENDELQRRNEELLDTITTLNSRAVMCISCMKKLDNSGVSGGGRSGAGALAAGKHNHRKGAGGSSGGSGGSNNPGQLPAAAAQASDAVVEETQTDEQGRKWVTVSIGEPFDRQVRRQLQEDLLKRQALQNRSRSQSASFSATAKGGKAGGKGAVNQLNLSPRGTRAPGASSSPLSATGDGPSGPNGPAGMSGKVKFSNGDPHVLGERNEKGEKKRRERVKKEE